MPATAWLVSDNLLLDGLSIGRFFGRDGARLPLPQQVGAPSLVATVSIGLSALANHSPRTQSVLVATRDPTITSNLTQHCRFTILKVPRRSIAGFTLGLIMTAIIHGAHPA